MELSERGLQRRAEYRRELDEQFGLYIQQMRAEERARYHD